MLKLNAKSVLERDLASLQAKRAEREIALRAERLRASGKEVHPGTLQNETNDVSDDAPMKRETNIGPSLLSSNDSKIQEAKVADQSSAGSSAAKHELPGGNVVPSSGAMGGDANQMTTDRGQTPQELKDLGMTGDIFRTGLGTTGFSDLTNGTDFDTMFNNDSGATGPNALNFGLDFSSSNATMVTGSKTDVNNLETTSSEDINSLLPGLENYVNADGDSAMDEFAMLDVAEGDTVPNAALSTALQQTSTASQNTPGKASVGSGNTASTDANLDIFFEADNLEDGGNGEVKIFDFDDWFN